MQKCRVPVYAGRPEMTVHVYEVELVRRALPSVGDQVLLDDRFSGGGEPLFPLAWAVWLLVGMEQVIPA
jgi:hypothetical protein